MEYSESSVEVPQSELQHTLVTQQSHMVDYFLKRKMASVAFYIYMFMHCYDVLGQVLTQWLILLPYY